MMTIIMGAWLIDITQQQLEIYLQPSAEGYRQMLKPARNPVVSPAFSADLRINLSELFAY